MKIAITGGSGFIGRRLVNEYIVKGYEVRVLSRDRKLDISGAKMFYGDLSDPDCDFSKFVKDVDILYHCAGEVINKSLMHEIHVSGSGRLIKHAKNNVKLWIQLSSVGAYGSCQQGSISASSMEAPVNIYEITKTKLDSLVKASGIPFVIIRPSIVFGLDMRNKSLFQLIATIKKGLFFYIGRAGAIVNYIEVGDVVKAMILCGHNRNAIGNTYILSQNITIEEMVESLRQALKVTSKLRRIPKWFIQIFVFLFTKIPGFPLTLSRVRALTGRCYYDSEKIISELGYKFDLTLERQLQSFAKKIK
jgi:nucleoside-diphosphate-sugar epimerase